MGLRTAATSTVSSNSDAAKIMAPALTDPISHQSKISSPNQASSPRPIISDHIDLNQHNNTQISDQTNSNNLINHQNQYFYSDKSISQNKGDFQLAFINHTISNGPKNGPSAVSHMDHTNDLNININNDNNAAAEEQQKQQQQQHQEQQLQQHQLHQLQEQLFFQQQQEQHFQLQQQLRQEEQEQFQQQLHQQQQEQQYLAQQQFQHLSSLSKTSADTCDIMQTTISTLSTIPNDIQSQQHNQNFIASSTSIGPVGNNNMMNMQKDFLKENAEMEQMLGELASTSEIDLLQVFKSFESAPAGENLCDLAGSLSLFNDVDVMNIGLEDVVTNTSPVKESPTQEMFNEIEKKRARMIRECDFMMRRLRKVQSHHMGKHVNEEIHGVFEYTQQLIKRKERETKSISTMTPINQLQNDKHKMNSATSMKMLLKRIEHSATSHQTSPTNRYSGSSQSTAGSSSVTSDHYLNNSNLSSKYSVSNVVPQFDPNGIQQIEQMAGLLSAELRVVEDAFDSDATASSSGGESADEMVSYNNATQQPLSTAKRAAWRWARDRARVAARWTWLLTQISELEYRIRQHHELYLLLKRNNGPVTFDGVPASESESSSIIDSSVTSDLQIPPLQQSVNGYRGLLPGNIRSSDNIGDSKSGEIEDGLPGAARTRPFQWQGFKKRKLLQSTNLHKISKRAARPSTIKCGCRWPVHPCLLCTGRIDPTAPRDLPDMLSTQENVALLDPCFHPVLSFPEDVPQSIHIEGTLRQPDWQAKAARSSSKAIIKGALALQKATEREDRVRKNSETQNTTKKLSTKKYNLVTNKLKKVKNNNRKMKKSYSHLLKGKSKARKNSYYSTAGSDIAGHHDTDIASPNGSISRSKNPSPTPGSSHKYERMYSIERRHNKKSYDIDNIVIPYNIAASHRVEILSYKEIPTPNWRLIDDEEDEIKASTSQDETIEKSKQLDGTVDIEEDVSLEAIQTRHERALLEERKKFRTFLKFPYSTRSRANRRINSQADSSGANTPDPMSPAPSTPAQNIIAENDLPVPSLLAPATSQSGENSAENTNDAVQFSQPTPLSNNTNGTPNSVGKRRRTVSLRKGSDPREEFLRRSNTPDIKETNPPFEPLEFPLTNDTIEKMIECMPNNYKEIIDNCLGLVNQNSDDSNKKLDGQHRPNNNSIMNDKYPLTILEGESDDTESAIEEDPNDPEWNEQRKNF